MNKNKNSQVLDEKLISHLQQALSSANYTKCLPQHPTILLDRFAWLVALGSIICPEYRFKWPQLDWWQNKFFIEFTAKFPEENSGCNNDRKWNLIQMLRICRDIEGDTVECGCYKGASSWIILEQWKELFFTGKKRHFIFDSFEGLSEPGGYDGSHWVKNSMAASEETVRCNLSDFVNCFQIYRGWIPDKFDQVKDFKFSFVHIDVDIYSPTKDSIEFFYPRLNAGGILICDDYGFTSCPGATKAIDDFLVDKPEKMLSFASGGGWIMKGLRV